MMRKVANLQVVIANKVTIVTLRGPEIKVVKEKPKNRRRKMKK